MSFRPKSEVYFIRCYYDKYFLYFMFHFVSKSNKLLEY